ncbi:MAG: DUF4869 domain-containing protein [bacterium]|nr:DUF4869 domain-containing protein [bacterium]
MLRIFFGEIPAAEKNYIYDTSMYFDNSYKEEWVLSDLGKKIINDVDNSEVIDGQLIQSPVLGKISPKELSGGVKTLLLILFDNSHIFNASTCGDNCAIWLLKISDYKRIFQHEKTLINLRHIMDFGKEKFSIWIENTNKKVSDMNSLVLEAGDFV